MKQVKVNVTDSELEFLKSHAEKESLSLSAAIRNLIKKQLLTEYENSSSAEGLRIEK